MVTGAAGYSSQQPNQYDPALLNVATPTRTWLTTGNTDTVIDASVHPTSNVLVTPVSTTPAGTWKVTITQGQFVVTSSDSESAGQTYNYIIL